MPVCQDGEQLNGWTMWWKIIVSLETCVQRFAAQNLQNQMAQLASSIQQPAQRQSAHILQQVPPQSRPQPIHHVSVQKGPEAVQTFSVHPSRQQQQVQVKCLRRISLEEFFVIMLFFQKSEKVLCFSFREVSFKNMFSCPFFLFTGSIFEDLFSFYSCVGSLV